MRLDVFGKIIEVSRDGKKWQVFYIGEEGKKRLAEDISIPGEIQEDAVPLYLADILHEMARPGKEDVKVIE